MSQYWHNYEIQRGFDEVSHLVDLIKGEGEPLGYIAGSYAAWMKAEAEEWKPTDVDIFTTSQTSWLELDNRMLKCGYLPNTRGEIVNSYFWLGDDSKRDVQLIAPHPDWKNFPDDILEAFDLTAAMALLRDGQILAHPDAGGCTSKILKINDPIRVLKRVMKYHQRGVQFDAWELVKLFAAWDEMTEEQKMKSVNLHRQSDTDEDEEDYESSWDEFFFSE